MVSGFLVEACGAVFLVGRKDKSGCVVEFPVSVRGVVGAGRLCGEGAGERMGERVAWR